MKLLPAGLDGAWVVELERLADDRGWFARSFDATEFGAAGLEAAVVQANISFNERKGTFRGLHYQEEPHGEAKLIRCVTGAVHDVAVDLRPASPTYRRSIGLELCAGDGRQLFLPAGVAHGYLTLEDNTELTYLMSHAHVPDSGRGVRWDDPAFGITLPAEVALIAERDRTFPDFIG